jgi:hypothetical protein
MVGSPEISATILQKIENCSIFVADITPVGSLIIEKKTPNPNVLFELGYAWRKLGESRVILVLNEAFAAPEDLPFDLLKRSLILYRRDRDASDGPGSVRSYLTSSALAAPGSRSEARSGRCRQRLHAMIRSHPVSLLHFRIFLLSLLHGLGLQFLRSPVQPDKYTPGG